MKRKRYSTEQIVAGLKQVALGLPVADLVPQLGVFEQTYYRWKRAYGGLESDRVRELKQVVDYVVALQCYSQRRAYRLTRQHRSTPCKPSRRDPRTEIR